jgi:hypothetical protein
MLMISIIENSTEIKLKSTPLFLELLISCGFCLRKRWYEHSKEHFFESHNDEHVHKFSRFIYFLKNKMILYDLPHQ